MSRRMRRRLFVLGACAAAGLLVPVWAPRLLATLPVFRVERIEVVGTHHVPPDEVVRLADVHREASVWDDPSPWERRVRSHPMIREARVHRRQLRALEILVVEERPVALAATPELVPVNERGVVLPLNPAAVGLDLPVLRDAGEVEDGRLVEGPARALAGVLGRLDAYDAAFVRQISEVGWLRGGGVEVRMLEPTGPARILLPAKDPVAALRRIELALGEAGAERVERADARFAAQVVLALEGGAG